MIKVVSRLASLLIVAGVLVFFSNCGGDDPKDPAQKVQLEKLSKTWTILSAHLGSDERTSDFETPDFTLTITGTFNSNSPDGNYNFSVGGNRPDPSPWPANGQWKFITTGAGDSGAIQRIGDGITMSYSINSSGQLNLTFNCPIGVCNYDGDRNKEVNGDWTFVLN